MQASSQISAAPCFVSGRGERVQIQGIYANSNCIADSQLITQSQADLGNSLLATQKQNEFFSKTFIEHERAYTEMKNSSIENQKTSRMLQADIKHFGALLDKLDRLLSQRKLGDFE